MIMHIYTLARPGKTLHGNCIIFKIPVDKHITNNFPSECISMEALISAKPGISCFHPSSVFNASPPVKIPSLMHAY